MLVIGRRVGESIVIVTSEGQITVTVTAAWTGRANVGIDAPANVAILRSELVRTKEDAAVRPAASR